MRVCFEISKLDPFAIQVGIKEFIGLFDDKRSQFLRRENTPVQNTEADTRQDKEQGNSNNDNSCNYFFIDLHIVFMYWSYKSM